jgi:hypothetical protein
MRYLLRRKPSPGTVLGALALLVALGGTSYAAVGALPRASVGTLQLQNGAVTSLKVANGGLRRIDFAPGVLIPGPAGAAGPQGPAGATGATGPAGPAGTVDTTQYYKKTESDARYLRRTQTIVASISVPAGSTQSLSANCSSGYEAVGGGVDADDPGLTIRASGPIIAGTRLFSTADGQRGAATGWRATYDNSSGNARDVKLAVICAPFST